MIGEFCDDGDISSADKCEGDCSMPVTGWICTGGSPTTPRNCVPECGDGLVLGTEPCDDANLVDLDGCSSTCT